MLCFQSFSSLLIMQSFVSKSMAIQVAFDENLLYEFDDCKCCEACLAQWKDSYCTGECQ